MLLLWNYLAWILDWCQYIEFLADHRLIALDCGRHSNVVNPIEWMDTISLQGKTNFFEKRVGEYAKSGVGVDASKQVFNLDSDFIFFSYYASVGVLVSEVIGVMLDKIVCLSDTLHILIYTIFFYDNLPWTILTLRDKNIMCCCLLIRERYHCYFYCAF